MSRVWLISVKSVRLSLNGHSALAIASLSNFLALIASQLA